MRIHTDAEWITMHYAATFAETVSRAAVNLTRCDRHGSRSHARSFDVTLTSDGTLSRRRVNYGTSRTRDRFDRPYAATFDQWGHFLAYVYASDPGAKAGPYTDAASFHALTSGRYTDYDGRTYTARTSVREDTEPRIDWSAA